MGQAVNGKAAGLGFFLDDEQQPRALAVGPFEQQGHVQLAKAFAQAFLQQFLPHRGDAGLDQIGIHLLGGKEGQGLPGIVEDEVLEVLVMHGRLAVSRGLLTGRTTA